MASRIMKTMLGTTGLAASVLLAVSGSALAQTVDLAATPTQAALPDGQAVPMWGYFCGTVADSTGAPVSTATGGATCSALNPNAGGNWSPVVITVPYTGAATSLTVNLTNSLRFQPATPAGAAANPVPTSLVIVGQLGGGLGLAPTRVTSPAHVPQGTTWPGTNGGVDSSGCPDGGGSTGTFCPPGQPMRAQSFATEVGATKTTSLTWSHLRPGTYLIESGTHPSIQGPMGLYGVLVVTKATQLDGSGQITTPGQAYPAVSYASEIPLLLSEIDAAQNAAVSAAVNTAGFSETATRVLRDSLSLAVQTGGTHYQHGDLITFAGGGPDTPAAAHVDTVDATTGAILSIILDNPGSGYSSTPVATVTSVAGTNATFSITLAQSGPTCRDNATGADTIAACYPAAVNYDPRYYLINGVSFDRTTISTSLFPTQPASVPGGVLVRFVNAGLRAHVPSIVGAQTSYGFAAGTAAAAGFSLIAEDGNPLPGKARIQNQVFLAAGKTYDVMIDAPSAGTPALPVFDRQLSLSTNNQRDGGMLAYIGANGGAAPSGSATTASVKGETYYCTPGATLSVTDPARGVLANDVGANGATLGSTALNSGDVLAFNPNGTFTYTSASSTTCGGTFTYLVNGNATLPGIAKISQCDSGGSNGCTLAAAPVANNLSFTSNNAKHFSLAPPGVFAGVTNNSAGLVLTASSTPVGVVGPDGSINVDSGAVASVTFSYQVKNSQGTSSNTATVTVNFPAASNLQVNIADAKTLDAAGNIDYTAGKISDYRWIIEEDRTFPTDPNAITTGVPCTAPNTPVGCKAPVANLGTNFHTSHMPVVAQGCVGAISCESGQTWLNPATGSHDSAVCDQGNGVCRAGDQLTEVDPSQVYLDPNKRYYISILPGDGENAVIGGAGGPASGTGALTQSGRTVTLNSGDGFFGVVKGDKITVSELQPDGSTKSADCTVTLVGPNSLKCTVPNNTHFSASDASYANNRTFDIGKDCGPYKNVQDSFWEPGGANAKCGHVMGGATIAAGQKSVNIALQENPLTPAKISVFVFEDDSPLNGENDAGGGVDILAPNEPGLEAFNLILLDQGGMLGDSTGQITYDMFNMPVSNSLANMRDPANGNDACPINQKGDGIVGTIPVCPKYESDGTTLSPLAGQAVIANLYPGLYEVVATPGADRIARGEQWLQTNTLDGTKPIEAFIRPGEPSYFQEFGPGGYHVAVGFANPAIIKARKGATGDKKSLVCSNSACNVTINGHVTNLHMSRTPDQRVYSSGDYTADGFTQCYASIGPADGPDFDFANCDGDGNFTFSSMPAGDLRITIFDQWNDLLVDGLSTPIRVCDASTTDCSTAAGVPANTTNTNCTGGASPVCSYELAVTQWRTNLYTSTFIDKNGDGVRQDDEPGLPLVSTNIRYRDGSIGFFNNTDLFGNAGFNEVFPLLNTLVVETDSTRYKQTGVHIINDTGGPVDKSDTAACDGSVNTLCGNSALAAGIASTYESPTSQVPLALRAPRTRYCPDGDCSTPGSFTPGSTGSSGRVDPEWTPAEAWQGLLGQGDFIEFGKVPYADNENGGIKGHVIYASTRPFDDPQLLLQLSWEPGIPNVRINLYKVGTGADGSETRTLVDHTTTTSFDDWAQGFRRAANGNLIGDPINGYVPNMNCAGVETSSPFYFTLENSTQFLNPNTPLAEHARFKCFDGWASLNIMEPAPYDGMYKFPSVRTIDPATQQEVLELDAKTFGTNCTICKPNPVDGTPMLPAGKYIVEAVTPAGYELVKEEDKNILIGDVFVAPVTQQFAGLGNIYIMPDQAAVNSTYNANNPGGQNLTTDLGATPRREGDTGSLEQFWPCVGDTRTVPDYNSIFPGAGQQAPFAGANRPLCDRKEVVLNDQMSVLAKFYLFSSTHVAGHFTGAVTNDFASEFDPFSPQFGEKFAVPNLPVSMRDFNGHEMERVYTDQWGLYNGLNYSSWDVNPPNPTGYVPQMMIACMNDPGPIPGPNGTMITDPMYNPAYSNYCYEIPFMPGQTAYLDTPVIPTMAFADNYNLPDCNYPDSTPGIASVLGDAIPNSTGKGPWVSNSGTGHTLTITSLGASTGGMVDVPNHAYSGPNATKNPFNTRTVKRYYGFGSTPGTVALVGGDGVPHALTDVQWSEFSITGTVPANVPTCAVQQRNTAAARCGELVVTNAAGKSSIDAVTVTIGGKAPSYVTPASPSSTLFGQTRPNPLQNAIDTATPGDLIIVGPGTYKEVLLMWKPVRLQGVGAGSVTINADAHPAGNLDSWRRQVDCLFGLSLNGRPLLANGTVAADPYDSTGQYTCPANMRQRVDRIPFETIVGWDTTGNGNLAQLLQEPTLMGAYEGAGITVLGRGIRIPNNSNDFWGAATAGDFPANSVYLTAGNQDCNSSTNQINGRDYGTSNYLCNPSRIDGISVINSSQGGGAIFLHAWNHNMEIANNRISANHGTLTGGITIGNGEFPDPYTVGGDTPPMYSLNNGGPYALAGHPAPGTGEQAGYGFNRSVNVHHNSVTANASIGDALYSGTPSAAGGVSFCSGSDFYKFNYNWICGNLSSGDGGGVAHVGMSDYGTIAHNQIVFNQSTNPTIPTHGGGLAVLGASPDRTLPNGIECGNTTSDADCPPGLPEGTGRGLLIDANLIMGNSAESGSGGGIRFQSVNGQDVGAFPRNSNVWYSVTATNNIIANNVAGWDGGGVSMQDSLKVSFINNTVVANDTTASSGVLFNTLGAPLASVAPPGCVTDPSNAANGQTCPAVPVPTSTPQAAGLVTMANTPNLIAAVAANVSCPSGFGYSGGATSANSCRNVSKPLLTNDLFWQNRPFHIEVGGLGTGAGNQQNVVYLEPLLNQTFTGMCSNTGLRNLPGTSYWDIGVRGDGGPTNASSGVTLATTTSIISSTPGDAALLREYCNGSRLPPENGGNGYNVPPGHSEATGLYPLFSLSNITPAATVDEGNNWINLGYGPLSLVNPVDNATVLGNYAIAAGSSARDTGTNSVTTTFTATQKDFFSTTRPQGTRVDIGAVEFKATTGASASISPQSLDFGEVQHGTSANRTLTLSNNGSVALTTVAVTVGTTPPFSRTGGTCLATLAAGSSCTIVVTYTAPAAVTSPPTANTGTVTVTTGNATVAGSPVPLAGTSVNPPALTVAPGSLTFGNTSVGTTSAAQNLTVTNTGGSSATNLTVTFTGAGYKQAGGTCGAALAPGGNCTLAVTFSPLAAGVVPGTAAVKGTNAANGNAVISATPASVTLTGTGTAPTLPALNVLDNFNRANANTLGASWLQGTIFGSPPIIRVNNNQAVSSGFLLPGYAVWNAAGSQFGASQAAALKFVQTSGSPATPGNGSSLILKANGAAAPLYVPQSYVFVRYNRTAGAGADTITVQTSTTGALGLATAGTITLPAGTKFATNDTLTAWATNAGTVNVFRNSTYLGTVQLPANTLWSTGGGEIGMSLPAGTPRVDDFAGGTVP